MQQTPPIAYFKGMFVNVLWYDSRVYPLQFCHKVICSNVSHSFMLLKISDSNTIIMFQTFVKTMPFANVNSRDFLFKIFIKIYVDNIYDYKNTCPICRGFEKVVYKYTNTKMQKSVGFASSIFSTFGALESNCCFNL